jgi:putative transcriptional regulator
VTDADVHDELWVVLFGGDQAAEARARAHLQSCEACQKGEQMFGRLWGAVAGYLSPVSPPSNAREKLLERVRQDDRLSHFLPELSELFDLTQAQTEALIRDARDPNKWQEGPAPGVELLPVNTGPRARGIDRISVLVKLEPGATLPQHTHAGTERVLVIQGGYKDSGGREVWRGEVHRMEPASTHHFTAVGNEPCICASLSGVEPED